MSMSNHVSHEVHDLEKLVQLIVVRTLYTTPPPC
jgi:hypothetical protein